jgi:DNA-binding MarR family transcriptional regulator
LALNICRQAELPVLGADTIHNVRSASQADEPIECGRATCRALDSDLGWALRVVVRTYLKMTTDALCGVPGGPRGYQLLAAAEDLPGTQLAMAHRLGIDRTVMTYLLDDLESAGLVERQPDPTDRRARRIQVTGSGRRLLEERAERLKGAEDDVLAALDPTDREAFRALLRRLATHADAAPREPTGRCDGASTGQREREFTGAVPADRDDQVEPLAEGEQPAGGVVRRRRAIG